jgi:hypothetical protein
MITAKSTENPYLGLLPQNLSPSPGLAGLGHELLGLGLELVGPLEHPLAPLLLLGRVVGQLGLAQLLLRYLLLLVLALSLPLGLASCRAATFAGRFCLAGDGIFCGRVLVGCDGVMVAIWCVVGEE